MLWRRTLEWAALTLLFLVFVFKTDVPDVVLAAAVACLTVVGIGIAAAMQRSRYAMPQNCLAVMARLPMAIIKDSGKVLWFLIAWMLLGRRQEGQLVEVPYDYGEGRPEDAARLAITLAAISVAPNTVAIAPVKGAILIHQLTPVPNSPERRDPKWPV